MNRTLWAVALLVVVACSTQPSPTQAPRPSPGSTAEARATDQLTPTPVPALTVECLIEQRTCDSVLAALGHRDVGARLVRIGVGFCWDDPCTPLLGPDLVVGVLVTYHDRPAPAPFTCLSMAGRDTISCGPGIEPTYRVDGGGQLPGTIRFGIGGGDWIQPFSGYPAGFIVGMDLVFGAYFGRSADVNEVSIVLYRQDGEDWTRTWSEDRRVDPETTGLLFELPAFVEPWLYKVEVSSAHGLLASALLRVAPPCVTDCAGG